MKKTFFFFIAFVINALLINGQEISGQWNGLIKFSGMQMHVVFHIQKDGEAYSATVDSPDQGAMGFPCDSVLFDNNHLRIVLNAMNAQYEGDLQNDSIKGEISQNGMKLPLNFGKEEAKSAQIKHSQEPVPPFPYYSENVKFVNKIEGNTLAGTLTLPKKEGVFPVVVLITGSGAQNRDEELLGHKPFLVIADFLTRNGVGVLRYDDRGTAESTGDFKTATSFDFSKDAEAAVQYLMTRKEVNKKKIGLIGHSEGGIIAPMVAARNKNVAFLVLLAGPGVRGNELLVMQAEAIGKASGLNEEQLKTAKETNQKIYNLVINSTNTNQLKSDLRLLLKTELDKNLQGSKSLSQEQKDAQINRIIDEVTSPWLQYFVKYDPSIVLKQTKIPLLALNGSKDLQVPAEPNLNAIKAALQEAGNAHFKTVELEGLNHLFQECKTGLFTEYGQIEQTFSPKALDEMLNWIKMQIK